MPGGLGGKRAMVLGAGEVAEGVLRALLPHGVAGAMVVNRQAARATSLAAAWGAVAAAWDDLDSLLGATDVVFVSTGSNRPVLSAERLAAAVGGSRDRRITVLDLSVPRNVEPSARSVRGVRLFDLDDLQQLRCPASGFAAPAMAQAEHVLMEEIVRLQRALAARHAAPRLAELHRLGSRLIEEETARALEQLGEVSDREREVVREMAERLVRRVLYPVSRSLREDPPPPPRLAGEAVSPAEDQLSA
jgi:glutamyl-tRNA reductase